MKSVPRKDVSATEFLGTDVELEAGGCPGALR